MHSHREPDVPLTVEDPDFVEPVRYDFGVSRRGFVQVLGAGLLVVATAPAAAQRAGGRPRSVSARLHLGQDGIITVLTGKVELGQGARAELTQAAAEELRVPVERVQLVMADTGAVPDDGLTAGSRTTPSTVPSVRQGAAAARGLLVELACKRWGVEPATVEVRDGVIVHSGSGRKISYAELAADAEAGKALEQTGPSEVSVTPVKEWRVLGTSVARPNRRDLVTGAHRYASDMTRPGMLHGKVLRAPSYGAELAGIDLEPAKAMKDVVVVRDGSFVGVAAPTTFRARAALGAIAQTATWKPAPHPSSKTLFAHLKEHAQSGGEADNPFAAELAQAAKVLRETYRVAYIQHAPLEPRAALAEWSGDKLTVWSGTQNPFGYRGELARALRLGDDQVRVIVPDTGGGFGGKHTGEAAIEAARLAQAAGKPVSLRWTREEEFTWAYCRPAGLIEIEGGLDAQGKLAVWHFININSGGAAIDTPYKALHARSRAVSSQSPLRQGSYRALAATANTFARECFMDELAIAAGADPLGFRLAHLENPRLRAVLEAAAKRFDWATRYQRRDPATGVGLACGTEKGSYVAACVEVGIDRETGRLEVRHVCEVFECGAILNPRNLEAQVQGAIIMGLGAALREEMQFEDGKLPTTNFDKYLVPRLKDVPQLDIQLLDRPDLPSVGGGETPIIAVAPAVANAVFHATGTRIRQMPIRLGKEPGGSRAAERARPPAHASG
jgi:isoquinoline 1-oxidoreductase